jgi:hypothetical protein
MRPHSPEVADTSLCTLVKKFTAFLKPKKTSPDLVDLPKKVADDVLPNQAVVVRGGVASAQQLMNGCAEHIDHPGIYGFSVQCDANASKEELARMGSFPNKKLSVTTVGRIRAAGHDVVRTNGRGAHATVTASPTWLAEDATRLAGAFEVESNPAQKQ